MGTQRVYRTVNATVEIDPVEILDQVDEETLRAAIDDRSGVSGGAASDRALLEQVWQHFRSRDDAPQALREYMWRVLGKAL